MSVITEGMAEKDGEVKAEAGGRGGVEKLVVGYDGKGGERGEGREERRGSKNQEAGKGSSHDIEKKTCW